MPKFAVTIVKAVVHRSWDTYTEEVEAPDEKTAIAKFDEKIRSEPCDFTHDEVEPEEYTESSKAIEIPGNSD